MKRLIIFSILATICGGQLMAQDSQEKDSHEEDNYLYVKPSTVYIASNTLQGTLNVWLDNVTDNFNSYMMDIYLPEDFSIPKKENSDDFDIQINTEKTPGHTVRMSQGSTGAYRIIGFSLTGIPVATGDGQLFAVTIQAPESFDATSTDVEGSIKNINIAAGTSGEPAHYFPDITFPIEYSTETNVEKIEQSLPNLPADIFNLQGVCVKNDAMQSDIDDLAPGIYIIGGKKVMVK